MRPLGWAIAAVMAAPALAFAAPTPADSPAAVAYANRQSLALAERSSARDWQSLPSGVRWRRVKGNGSGAHPATRDDIVTAHYAGTFIDGAEFDSSYKRAEPIVFPVHQVIPGWQQVLPLAGVGDTLEVAIPFTSAYGPRGKGPIPGGATLLFTIELLAVKPAAGE